MDGPRVRKRVDRFREIELQRIIRKALRLSLCGVVLVALSTKGQQPASPSATPQQSAPARPQPSPTAPGPEAKTPTAPNQSQTVLSLEDALRFATTQASVFQQASINEQIAAEDVKQAQAAFLPRISAPIDYIYTSPLLGAPPGTPRAQSFIAANAINEYQALVNVSGDIDISGRLRATLAKNRALLAAANAGTEVARRALAQTVIE